MFKLTGNDFNQEEIKKWYEEEEKYHNQFTGGRNSSDEYWSIYEEFNRRYAINNFVKFSKEIRVLSFGCAEGSDTAKLYKEQKFRLYGLEASEQLITAFKDGFPEAEIVKANIDGKIDYSTDFFDFIFCFGVLHHIPNVSFVLKEFHRVLKEGGIAVIREPICWMYSGDKRPEDLSPNERGIPVEFFREEFSNLNFEILRIKYSYYKPLMHFVRKSPVCWKFPSLIFRIDNILSRIPNRKNYFGRNLSDKFNAGCAYYVIKKRKT